MLIMGGSRGIGLAVAEHYHANVKNLICVSRTRSPFGHWIEADVAINADLDRVCAAFENQSLDALLYLGGIWEKNAFTADYDFANSSDDEIDRIIAVNLIAPIKLVKRLIPSLVRSPNPKVIFIGSLSGLDHQASREVANSASKFGLRGAVQALSIELKKTAIGLTVINPGNIATPEVLNDIASEAFPSQVAIPLSDLIAVIDCSLSLSADSYLPEVNLAQTKTG